MLPLFVNRLNVYLTAQRGALLGASGDQTAQASSWFPPGQTVSKLVGALFVVLYVFMFVSFRYFVFDVVYYFLSEPLGIDFELLSRPSDPQKP